MSQQHDLSLRPDRPLRGIGLVLLSTVFSSASDACAKLLAGELSGVEILWLRYIVFVLMAATALLLSRRPQPFRVKRPDLQIARALLIIASAALFILGLRHLQMAEATTTFYIAPVFVTGLSIIFLGEQVGIRRWLATIVGLGGVLVVVRPGTGAFDIAVLFPLASALFWAGSLIVTRKMSGIEQGSTTLFYTAAIGLVVLSALLPFVWTVPTPRQIAIGAFVGVVATTGQWIIIQAYRFAGASLLAPFSYAQIVWAALSGYLLFADTPSVFVFVGAAIIVTSGLYTAHRERLRLKQQRFA